MEDRGLVHLYAGDGKGKTTAAMGLALRALGQNKKVTVVQFLKHGQSGELKCLKQLGAQVISGENGQKFFSQMNDEEREECRKASEEKLEMAKNSRADLLILDEICASVSHGLVEEEMLKMLISSRPLTQEIVLTGRNPKEWMVQCADYYTEMKCHRHPYEKNINARRGIEY